MRPARSASPGWTTTSTQEETFDTEFTTRSNPHRGYITIIEGCDKFCSYCVVPYTRGKERSRASDSIMAEAQRMASQGFTDIQLLGQNVNSYRDPIGKRTFAEVLAMIGELPGIRRVRFTTSHPRDFTPDIIAVIDSMPTICDHVHLPVQSGSSAVLKAMQRAVHARVVPGAHFVDQGCEARHQHDDRHHRRLSRVRPRQISSRH